tara:strand:+ start:1986 stop:3605 length:1620 start_codon:yes stop_codon:yes gene_type:complete
MVDINKLVSKHYLRSDVLLEMIQKQLYSSRELLEEETPVPETEVEEVEGRDIVLKFTRLRLSEKMWGKEGTEDRAIIENIMSKIIAKGDTLKDKIRILSNFIQSPPPTNDISEILSHIVFLDTLTNIMVHFNASAAGFTFEGFLAALLGGMQIPATGAGGVQDLIDNDKMPISLKLLTAAGGEGKAAVEGSFKDLCDHFIDPGALRQDPESGHYLGGTAGAAGHMTYVIALKSFQESKAEQALEGAEAQTINFYQFDFNAYNFLDSMRSNPNNMKLLLLPEDLADNPTDDPATTDVEAGEQDLLNIFNREDLESLTKPDRTTIDRIIAKYDADTATELLSKMSFEDKLDKRGNVYGKRLVFTDTGKGMKTPRMPGRSIQQLPWEPPKGSEKLKAVGSRKHDSYLDVATSVRILEQALTESPEKFWGYIARSLGYVQGASGLTQFNISRQYYEDRSYDKHGMGFIGGIPVGRAAVNALAQAYVDVLNQEIFDLFEKVETLTNQINGYFVGGDKTQGLAAAGTANEIETGTREYVEKAEEA